MDKFYEIKDSRGVALQEYNGFYSIATARLDKNDTVWLEWSLKQKYDSSLNKMVDAEKRTPEKVRIGKKDDAIRILTSILNDLKAESNEDLPF